MRAWIFAALVLAGCVSAPKPDARYAAALNAAETLTGSAATADATLSIDAAAQTVSARIVVHGVRMSDLAQHLAHAPMGPIHLHLYKPDGDVVLIFPFPMGDAYAETADGFTVTVADAPYAAGAAILHSDLSFAEFEAALASGQVVLNIHTERFGDGEINGRVHPV